MDPRQRHRLVAAAALAVALGTPACGRSGEPSTGQSRAPVPATKGARPMLVPQREIIGEVEMRADGTLVLDLRHPWMHREIAPGQPEHDGIVAHVGGLSPGQSKPVPPWPDDINDEVVEERLQAYFRAKGIPPEECRASIEGKGADGRILVSVVRGAQHWRLRLHPGTYEVREVQ